VPFNLALGLAIIAFSQGDASVVVRRRQLLLDLAARAIKRIANTPSPNAAFAVPYLVKASVIDHAGFQQLDRAVFDFNVVHSIHDRLPHQIDWTWYLEQDYRDPIVCARRGRHARERRLKRAIRVAW
jgi:hypothetical protein